MLFEESLAILGEDRPEMYVSQLTDPAEEYRTIKDEDEGAISVVPKAVPLTDGVDPLDATKLLTES